MSQVLRSHYGGYRGTLLDARDFHADTSELPVLAERDPRQEIMQALGIYSQLNLGSCTANATSKAVDYDRICDGEPSVKPARLPIYWEERKIERSPLDQDTGAFGRDGFRAMRTVGYWPESEVPYSDNLRNPDFFDDPVKRHGKAPFKLAKPYKLVPRSIDHFKAVLSNRQTIAIGFTVYESFESPEVARTGVMPIPNPRNEQVLGGHEVLVIGYLKSEPQYALVENSWDVTWGLKGFFLMPWAVLMDPSMASDFRTITRPKGT